MPDGDIIPYVEAIERVYRALNRYFSFVNILATLHGYKDSPITHSGQKLALLCIHAKRSHVSGTTGNGEHSSLISERTSKYKAKVRRNEVLDERSRRLSDPAIRISDNERECTASSKHRYKQTNPDVLGPLS